MTAKSLLVPFSAIHIDPVSKLAIIKLTIRIFPEIQCSFFSIPFNHSLIYFSTCSFISLSFNQDLLNFFCSPDAVEEV